MTEQPPRPKTKAGEQQGKPPASTPMLTHYQEVQQAHPDCLVFYRMGDFYELFFQDAVTAAEALNITLTKRGKQAGQDVPMCGVPVHAAETYLSRLIRKGFKVAVCEQMENPAEAKKRGSKSLVKRDVVRVITPGTLTEETLLDASSHNYLLAIAETQRDLGIAWLDMTTGDFFAQDTDAAALAAALARLQPGEVLVSDRLLEKPDFFDVFAEWKDRLTVQPSSRFDSENAGERLRAFYQVATLDAFGPMTRPEVAAAGALLDYVELTQKGKLPRLGRLSRMTSDAAMEIDAATRRNLELIHTLSGEKSGSLLSTIDRTTTGAGARLLASHLSAPLTDVGTIVDRLDMVQFFVESSDRRSSLREILSGCPDIERALSRLSVGRGGPRDLSAIREAMTNVPGIREALAESDTAIPPEGIKAASAKLGHHDSLVDRLTRALASEVPLMARDGGFIAAGYSAELDEQLTLRGEGRNLIAALEARYKSETGISSLKVRHNNVLGYFVEVTNAQSDKLPTGSDSPFMHRQTMVNAARFTTVELSELEVDISRAADKALALELAFFEDLVSDVMGLSDGIAEAARGLAELDVASALAELAIDKHYCRPTINNSTEFEILGGRHPVVEHAQPDTAFVANDCDLGSGQHLWLLTGPNMAGKSTFLRQNALIAILAQMGSFVPATAARIGVVDRLFSRVGAADDLARGRSTFMVEMVETAAILNQATERSLVILDEIGRGTATFDGLSIAWATVEHIHEINQCRALFATHYHELTALASHLDGLSCHTMKVKEWRGDVVFLHEVGAGNADRSYGIHVARLAGLPASAIARSEAVLASLEEGDQSGSLRKLADDLPLFTAAAGQGMGHDRPEPSAIEQLLEDAHPDSMTPREALDLLYKLKSAAKKEEA